MGKNPLYEVLGEEKVPPKRNNLKYELIGLRDLRAIEKCPYPLRQIGVYDPGTNNRRCFFGLYPVRKPRHLWCA
jgi:hypothetical protein